MQRFIITGTGRCGTQFVSAVLNHLRIPTGHETVYNPFDEPEWPEHLVGDVSWLAVPHLDGFDGVVIHLTRDEDDVIASMKRIGFLSGAQQEIHDTYADIPREFLDMPDLTPETFVEHWKARIETVSQLTIDVADLDTPGGWDPIWEALDVVAPPDIVLSEAIHNYRYANTRGHMPWDNTTVGFVHDGNVLIDFNNFIYRCGRRHINVIGVSAGSRVPSGRNRVVERFLDETDHEWLFMIDTDHNVPQRSLETLFAAADPTERPVVGGITFRRNIHGKLEPTTYRVRATPGADGNRIHSFQVGQALPDNSLIEVDATGAACLLVHRSVLEAMQAEYSTPYVWFQDTQIEDEEVGEDITFCFRARNLGYPIYVHTGAEFPHVKLDGFTWNRWQQQQAYDAMIDQELQRFTSQFNPQTEDSLLSHYDKNPNAYYSPLDQHSLEEVMLTVEAPLLRYPLLDMGCGDGRVLRNDIPAGAYVGVDYSENRIRAARQEWPDHEFVVARYQDYVTDRKFATVLMVEFLEHLEDPKLAIKQAKEWLDPDGVIVATVPKDMHYHAHLQVYETVQDVEALNPSTIGDLPRHWVLLFR